MKNNETVPIWNPDTGIEDFEIEPNDLSSSEIPGIKTIWTEQQERLKDTAQLSDFTEKLSREWAIETGIIENLYEIDRGVTQTLNRTWIPVRTFKPRIDKQASGQRNSASE